MKNLWIISATCFFASLGAQAESKTLNCIGTEPFFSVEINVEEAKMTYTDPVEHGHAHSIVGPLQAAGVQDDVVMVFKCKSMDVSATLLSEKLAGKCSDRMSEAEHTYHLIYRDGQLVKYGCCN